MQKTTILLFLSLILVGLLIAPSISALYDSYDGCPVQHYQEVKETDCSSCNAQKVYSQEFNLVNYENKVVNNVDNRIVINHYQINNIPRQRFIFFRMPVKDWHLAIYRPFW